MDEEQFVEMMARAVLKAAREVERPLPIEIDQALHALKERWEGDEDRDTSALGGLLAESA